MEAVGEGLREVVGVGEGGEGREKSVSSRGISAREIGTRESGRGGGGEGTGREGELPETIPPWGVCTRFFAYNGIVTDG
jgi:uncharacterized protein YgiB involved in biofilm formation